MNPLHVCAQSGEAEAEVVPAAPVDSVVPGAPVDSAQPADAAAPAYVPPAPVQASPAPAAPALPTDGVRFRWGITASGGGEFVSDYAFGMGGVEGRVGIQINNLLGIYIQPALSFGSGTVGAGVQALTGTASVSALVDFTIADHFFVAAGGGVGVLNNPVGPQIHMRIGAYPLVAVGGNGYSRHGLIVGADARVFFLDAGGIVPVMQLMGSVGYEAF